MPAHKNLRLWLPISFLLVLFALTSVLADDGAMEGVGGSLRLMKEHPGIHMLSERVMVDLYPRRAEVDCSFTFKNAGPATTVRMGFPESGGGTDVDPKHPNGFSHFESWVDNVRVKTRIEGLEGQDQSWERWRVKTVRFAKGQKRLVRVRYGGGLGGTSDGTRYFEYRLDTGASWKGNIGKADVIIHLKDFRQYWNVGMTPPGYRRKGNLIAWHWENLKPGVTPPAEQSKIRSSHETELIREVSVSFRPGYNKIVLNGKWIPYGELYGFPELENSQAWALLIDIARWLDARLEYSAGRELGEGSSKTARLVMAKRVLSLKAGLRKAEVEGRTVMLQKAPRMRDGRIYVSANEIITLLGGTARFDKKTGITYLTLPKK